MNQRTTTPKRRDRGAALAPSKIGTGRYGHSSSFPAAKKRNQRRAYPHSAFPGEISILDSTQLTYIVVYLQVSTKTWFSYLALKACVAVSDIHLSLERSLFPDGKRCRSKTNSKQPTRSGRHSPPATARILPSRHYRSTTSSAIDH